MSARFRQALERLRSGDLRRARASLLEIARSASREAPWACQQLVQSYLQRGHGNVVERRLQTSLDDPVRSFGLGYLHRRADRHEQAETLLEAAANANPPLDAALLELSSLRLAAGQEDAAQRLLRRADRRFRTAGDDWGLAAAIALRAVFALRRFDLDAAVSLSDEATRLRRRLGDHFGLGFTLQLTSKARHLNADYVGAIASLGEALRVHTEAGHIVEAAVTHNNIGLWHLDLSDPQAAVDSFLAARRLFARVHDGWREAVVLSNLGTATKELYEIGEGTLRRSARYFRSALDILAAADNPDAHGIALSELARALTAAGSPTEALALLADPRTARRRAMTPRTRLLLAIERVRALSAAGHTHTAHTAARRATHSAAKLPGSAQSRKPLQLQAAIVRAEAALADSRPKPAVTALTGALRGLEEHIAAQRTASVRIGLLDAHQAAHDALVACHLARGASEQAWAATADAKARELRDSMTLPTPGSVTGPGRRGRAERRLDALTRRLSPTTALIEYHVATAASCAIVVHADEVQTIELPAPRRTLERAIRRLLEPMRAAGTSPEPRLALDRFSLAAAARLYRSLVAPVLRRLPDHVRRLVIAPDGPLHALPFELLVTRLGSSPSSRLPTIARFDPPTYLGDSHILSYARSSLLLEPSRCPTTEAAAPARLLAVAYSPPPLRSGAIRERRTPEGTVPLRPLPAIADELDAVRRPFRRSPALIGRAATVRRYRETAAEGDIIHIAAHAVADARSPNLSGVVLAPSGRSDPDGTVGFLSAVEIAATPLRAGLVTLSACDTAHGRLRGREGVLGLSRAFLEAGARSVLASLWPVEDGATRDLMTGFYARLASGDDRPRALAGAKRALRNTIGTHVFADRAHPFFWASFILIDHDL